MKLSAKVSSLFELPPRTLPFVLLFLLCLLDLAGNQDSLRTLPQLKPYEQQKKRGKRLI